MQISALRHGRGRIGRVLEWGYIGYVEKGKILHSLTGPAVRAEAQGEGPGWASSRTSALSFHLGKLSCAEDLRLWRRGWSVAKRSPSSHSHLVGA